MGLKVKKNYILVIFLLHSFMVLSQLNNTYYLWPGEVPNEINEKQPPLVTDNRKGNVTRITNITNPMLKIYRPDVSIRTGMSVIVNPGGGYNILAIDLEGSEVAEWLNSIGITAFVLQYRVPNNRLGAFNDIQRAIRMVRGNSDKWDLDPKKIGVLGFSAGGNLSAQASTRFSEKSYEMVDELDKFSARPDFTLLLYPAYLDKGPNRTLSPELKVDMNTPPMFLFVAGDDHFAHSSIVMSEALNKKKVSFEMHILPTGGHGFGLRKGNTAAEIWPVLAEKWLRTIFNQD